MVMMASSVTLVMILGLEVVKSHSETQIVNTVIWLANTNKVRPKESGPDFFPHELSVTLKEFE